MIHFYPLTINNRCIFGSSDLYQYPLSLPTNGNFADSSPSIVRLTFATTLFIQLYKLIAEMHSVLDCDLATLIVKILFSIQVVLGLAVEVSNNEFM